jgi:hypothetical protein
MLEETLAYVSESLDTMKIPAIPPDPAGKKLFEVLDIARVRHELQRRITDLHKNTKSSHHELTILRQMSDGMKEDRMFHLQGILNENTKQIANVVQANAEQSVCLSAVQVILAGTLAFSLLDRFTGTWSVTNRAWATSMIEVLLATPYLWLGFNIVLWLTLATVINNKVRSMGQSKTLIAEVTMQMNEECNLELLDIYLEDKNIVTQNVKYEFENVVQEVTWVEAESQKSAWGGACPKITILYDNEHAFILSIVVHYSKYEGKLTPKELRECVMTELTDNRVIAEREEEEMDEEDEYDDE